MSMLISIVTSQGFHFMGFDLKISQHGQTWILHILWMKWVLGFLDKVPCAYSKIKPNFVFGVL